MMMFVMAACSSGPMMMTGDDMQMVDAPPGMTLNPADCTAFAQSAVMASQTCGTQLPAGAQSTLEGFCKKGMMSAGTCGGNPAGGMACFKTQDPNDWTCSLGEAYPACGGDLASALGAYCLMALGNPRCASGIHCNYDTDCSGSFKCNGATGQCFDATAYCIGLPCSYDIDCPANEKCNNAEGVCVGR